MNVTPELDKQFRQAALREGLIDVTYDILDSPIGDLFVAATDRGLARISYWPDGMEETLARTFGPRVLRSPLDDVRRELDEYFEGRRRDFDLPIDWALVSPFGRRVLQATAAIPFGRVKTYGEMATQAGNPKASRAAGRALGANPIPIVVPCHRVIGASGRLTGYTGGLHRKVALLEIEGVVLPG
jgi:methylated-DNA-[protein]-cysteine S-methyltransferase